MIIGVDAGCLGIKDKRLKVGVYQVTLNLLREMGKIDTKNKYLLYSFWPIDSMIMAQLGSRMVNVLVRPAWGWNYLALPFNLRFKKPDVFLGPSQSLPFFCPCPTVVIVYDLAYEHFPDFYPDSYSKLKRMTFSAVKKANQIIAVSGKTKTDLQRLYEIPAEKIKLIYGGYDQDIFKPTKDKKENYFLYVGSLKRLKNIPGLLAGFDYFLKKSPQAFKLILVGGDLWLDPEIKKTINDLNLEKFVVLKGFVDRKKLPKLCQKASAFVSPSFYEGFGITLLEAAACGCPVIAGNRGAEKEVIGQAGILIDPADTEAIGQAMLKVIDNQKIRQKMIKKGLKKVKFFSWQNFAQGILEAINENRPC